MELEGIFRTRSIWLAMALLFLNLGTFTAYTQHKDNRQEALVIVKAIAGQVEYSLAGGPWQEATTNSALGQGTLLRTQTNSTADLFLPYSRTVLRLIPNSIVRIEHLERHDASIEYLTQTRLVLVKGSLVGSQRKLPRASSFAIMTAQGEAVIKGTEYIVRDDGAVTVLSGAVSVRYNRPGNGGSVLVMVQPGQSFNPATGTVVATTPEFLQDQLAHIDTVQQNAQTFRADGATIVVKPEDFISPFTPNGNNGVGNGVDGQPPGNPPVNDGPGTGPGNPGNQGGSKK